MIDAENNQLGVMQTADALAMARERNLDLVEVSPQAKPPVARIMDFGKFQYEQAKQRAKQKKSKGGQVKEIRLSMKIGEHDLQYRLERAREFLGEGNKVRLNLMMKGRENANPRAAMQRVRDLSGLIDGAVMESDPVRAGRSISAIITIDKKQAKPAAETADSPS